MISLNERLKKLRKALNLTQREFAERIGIKQNTLATYEIGRNQPIDAVVNLICREFNVSEPWLKTGEGEMFVQRSRDEELSEFVDKLLAEESTSFRRRLVSALSRLSPEQWELLEAVALKLMEDAAPPAQDRPRRMIPAAARGLGVIEIPEIFPDELLPESEDDFIP